MPKRVIASVLALLLSIQTTSCSSMRRRGVAPSELASAGYERIVGVTTSDGRLVRFDESGPAPTVARDTIIATVNGAPYTVAIGDASRVWIMRREPSAAKSIGAAFGVTAGVLAVAVGIALATKESCPFVYSWDGREYVFDAEPYGGTITRGLERDDYGELEHLVAADGTYRLLLRNEVNEVQYTNQLELMVVDHPRGTRVAADRDGRVHTLGAPQVLRWARDSQGRDLGVWLDSTDSRIWEPPAVPGADSSYRQDIVLAFPKPEGARQAKLVANVATGLWGSHMIRAVLELRGNQVGTWYAAIDERPSARDSVLAWNLREELYELKIYVEEPTGWTPRGLLLGGGPFIAEERVVPLDVSRVVGSELHLRIQPPLGFWALNSFAVDYSADAEPRITRVPPSAAQDHNGHPVLAALRTADGDYYAMPRTGDWAEVTFAAPAPVPGASRTVLLHSRGYYRLNLPHGGEADTAALRQIAQVPGTTPRLAAAAYAAYLRARTQ